MAGRHAGKAAAVVADPVEAGEDATLDIRRFSGDDFSGRYVGSPVGITPKLSDGTATGARTTILQAVGSASAAIASIVVSDDYGALLSAEDENIQIDALLADLRDRFSK